MLNAGGAERSRGRTRAHRAMRTRIRKRGIVVAAIALAVPMAVSASGAALAGGQAAAVASVAAPSASGDYLYSQLFTMSKAFSYRVSGADGNPQNPADPFNLPPTVNGWQELFAYWKNVLTSQQTNGQLASFATTTDHYFQRSGGYRFQSDDAPATVADGALVLRADHRMGLG